MYVRIVPTQLCRLYAVTKRTKGCNKGGCRNKKAVSELRERLVGGKFKPLRKL